MDFINMLSLAKTSSILSLVSNLSEIRYTNGLLCFGLEFIHSLSTIKCLADFLKSRTACLNEEEVDDNELNDQPTLKEEVKLPATSVDTQRNGVL